MIPRDCVHKLIAYQRKQRTKKKKIEKSKNKENKKRCSIEVRCKMLCSEKLPLWKLVIQLVRSPGKLQKRKPHTTFPFIFLTISSCLSKFLNTHSGRIQWIRHSQGLGRSLKMDTCLEVQKIEREQCTVQNCYTTRIPKYEHCPVEESRSIMASSWKEKKTHMTLYKSWLSPSRGDF